MNLRLLSSKLAIHRGAKTKSDSARPNKQNFLCSATFQEQSALLESAHVDDGIFVVMLLLRAHLSLSQNQPPRSSRPRVKSIFLFFVPSTWISLKAFRSLTETFIHLYLPVFLLIELSRLVRQLSNSPCAREKWISLERALPQVFYADSMQEKWKGVI